MGHPQKDINKAVRYAAANGFTVTEIHKNHRWGAIDCGHGCGGPIFSTPTSPTTHAKQLRRIVDRCTHHT